jgi:hypothetical protein
MDFGRVSKRYVVMPCAIGARVQSSRQGAQWSEKRAAMAKKMEKKHSPSKLNPLRE